MMVWRVDKWPLVKRMRVSNTVQKLWEVKTQAGVETVQELES
jgi:hypothetical protein